MTMTNYKKYVSKDTGQLIVKWAVILILLWVFWNVVKSIIQGIKKMLGVEDDSQGVFAGMTSSDDAQNVQQQFEQTYGGSIDWSKTHGRPFIEQKISDLLSAGDTAFDNSEAIIAAVQDLNSEELKALYILWGGRVYNPYFGGQRVVGIFEFFHQVLKPYAILGKSPIKRMQEIWDKCEFKFV